MDSRRTAELVLLLFVGGGVALCAAGCGTIKGSTATDQLLVSDAVDKSIEQMRFDDLAGQRVYLDTKYLKPVRSVGFVNSEYIVSSLREHLLRSGCRLQERAVDADYILEVRVGALGTDTHEVNYGVPGSQALNQTASLLANGALMPSIPEVSLAKKSERRAAAKIALFAYHRETKEPFWQTGTIQGLSLAQSTWVLGAGPFHKGVIYEEAEELAASPIELSSDQPMVAALGQPLRQLVQTFSDSSTGQAELTQVTSAPQLRPVPGGTDAGQVTVATAVMPVDAGPPAAAEASRAP